MLSPEPETVIGSEDGPEEYSLYQVRGIVRLDDGTIVIANNGSDELRYYDSNGRHKKSVGQDGYGPGEFKIMWGMWRVGDSLVISDRGQDRISVFSAEGEYGRTVMLHREPSGSAPKGVGVFSDGSILGATLVLDPNAAMDGRFEFSRTNASHVRFNGDGEIINTIGEFLFAEGVSETLESEVDEKNDRAISRGVFASSPFGRVGSTFAVGDFVYHGSGDSYEIQVYSKEGALVRLIRRPIENPPVTESDKDDFREGWLEGNGDWGRRRVNDLVFPETKPAFQSFTVDNQGNVWIAENATEVEDNIIEWTVFDTEGRMLGSVEVPRGGRTPFISGDYWMAVWYTELDVEQVRVYRVVKGRG